MTVTEYHRVVRVYAALLTYLSDRDPEAATGALLSLHGRANRPAVTDAGGVTMTQSLFHPLRRDLRHTAPAIAKQADSWYATNRYYHHHQKK